MELIAIGIPAAMDVMSILQKTPEITSFGVLVMPIVRPASQVFTHLPLNM
jgi:hypothetical protein